jgi:hypothetical protein
MLTIALALVQIAGKRGLVERCLAVGVMAATLGAPARAQDAAGGTFASYALDFCAAIVDGQSVKAAHAATSPGARLEGPRAAGDDADLVKHDLNADKDTSIIILGPPNNERRTLMAFTRADASRCMTFAGRDEGSLDALRKRLTAATSLWQEEISMPGASLYKRNASNGVGGLTLMTVEGGKGQAARVIIERSDQTIPILTDEQRAQWARAVVAQCAAGVHQRKPLDAEAFAPFFKVATKQADSLTLDTPPGQPGGVLFLNSRSGNACLLTIGDGGVPKLEKALADALLASGATAQGGTYRLRKPKGAGGRDAIFVINSSAGPLLVRVYGR